MNNNTLTNAIRMNTIQVNNLKFQTKIDDEYLVKLYTYCNLSDIQMILHHMKSENKTRAYKMCHCHGNHLFRNCTSDDIDADLSLGFTYSCRYAQCEYMVLNNIKLQKILLSIANKLLTAVSNNDVHNLSIYVAEYDNYTNSDIHRTYYMNLFLLAYNYPKLMKPIISSRNINSDTDIIIRNNRRIPVIKIRSDISDCKILSFLYSSKYSEYRKNNGDFKTLMLMMVSIRYE